MKTEQVKQVTDKALEQLITALEQGQSVTLALLPVSDGAIPSLQLQQRDVDLHAA